MIITERDKLIIYTIAKFRFLQGRHIKLLCNFCGQRATDRRLRKLIENNFVERKKILYGIAGIYTITEKARKQFHVDLSNSKIRVEQIQHDINVVDTAIYFMKKCSLTLNDIKTEKELQHTRGFGTRVHQPDFVFTKDNEKICVEIEMSLKAKKRLEQILTNNFLNYDVQYWIIPDEQQKIIEFVANSVNQFPNIEIVLLSTIQEYISSLKL